MQSALRTDTNDAFAEDEPDEAPRSSEVHVRPEYDMERILMALIDASEEKICADGKAVAAVLDPAKVLKSAFPLLSDDEIFARVEGMRVAGCLKKTDEGFWEVRLSGNSEASLAVPSVEDIIAQLRIKLELVSERLEQALLARQAERERELRETEAAIRQAEGSVRERIQGQCTDAKHAAKREKELREQARIRAARRTYEAEVVRIRDEEARRLRRDYRDINTDFKPRLRSAKAEMNIRRAEIRAERAARDEARDRTILEPLREELECTEADIHRLERLQDQMS